MVEIAEYWILLFTHFKGLMHIFKAKFRKYSFHCTQKNQEILFVNSLMWKCVNISGYILCEKINFVPKQ